MAFTLPRAWMLWTQEQRDWMERALQCDPGLREAIEIMEESKREQSLHPGDNVDG